ncbi:MAG TPA: hypothetical protein VMW76_00830 [Bacteroidales bacterium]|nr:hypothetical protein [Bacteroidales bacterium]
MDDLYFKLSQEEFSKGRKILLWIAASLFALIGFWDLYLKIFKHDSNASFGLTIVLFSISGFIFFIAFLASLKHKEHFFKVDNEIISYYFGLFFPSHHTYKWEEIDRIYMPPHQKTTILVLKDGRTIRINLTWVEKNKSRMIIRHIYYAAKQRDIDVLKKHIKK